MKVEVLSIGHDETCSIRFGGAKAVKVTCDELTDLYNLLSNVCYTMGFKSSSSPEEFQKALKTKAFGRLVVGTDEKSAD